MLVFIIKGRSGLQTTYRPTQMTNHPVATPHLHQLFASPYCCANLKMKVAEVQLGNTGWSFCWHGCARQGRIMLTRGLFSHLGSVFVSHRCPEHAVSVGGRAHPLRRRGAWRGGLKGMLKGGLKGSWRVPPLSPPNWRVEALKGGLKGRLKGVLQGRLKGWLKGVLQGGL